MAEQTNGTGTGQRQTRRSWKLSLLLAAAITGSAIGVSAVVNPLLGRYVHWDWMAFLAPAIFVLATVYLRTRP